MRSLSETPNLTVHFRKTLCLASAYDRSMGLAATLAPHDQLYRAFLERNPEFDGQFVTGVISTGIYCLPSCPARRPKPENVRFFDSPEEARRFGLRPCQRCHPDALYRGEAWAESIFERTAERIRRDPAAFPDVQAISRAAGLSRTALNQLFHEHAHESAGAFLRRARIDKAREALAGGATPVEAMGESGYESASAFHQQFATRTGLNPAAYARLAERKEFALQLPRGFRTTEVLDFQGRDRESVSERITESGFRKCVLISGQTAVIEISLAGGFAVCQTDAKDAFAAHDAVIRMLGFDCDPTAFERQAAESVLSKLVRRQTGLRVPLTADAWEALAWSVIGQQISLPAAVRLRRQVIANFGERHSSGMVAHPGPAVIAGLEPGDLTALRFPRFKAEYLIEAARAVAAEKIRLSREWSARHLAREMRNVRGIGPWTIEYALLRGIGFADCLPASDAGLRRGLERLREDLPNEPNIQAIMSVFSPFRSLATCHVWQSLKGKHE